MIIVHKRTNRSYEAIGFEVPLPGMGGEEKSAYSRQKENLQKRYEALQD